LRNPWAAFGWRGVRCHCRRGEPPEPVEPWRDPRAGGGALILWAAICGALALWSGDLGTALVLGLVYLAGGVILE
jgi:hypothetical protein